MKISRYNKVMLTLVSFSVILASLVSMNGAIQDRKADISLLSDNSLTNQKEIVSQLQKENDSLNNEILILEMQIKNAKETNTILYNTLSKLQNLDKEVYELKEDKYDNINDTKLIVEPIDSIPAINLHNISMPSNLSIEQFDELILEVLKNKKVDQTVSILPGNGKYLVEMENKYKINGLLALSTASIESGYGRSDLAIYKNNLFGINSINGYRSFESVEECYNYYGNLIRTSYLDKGFDTIYKIGGKYCPGNQNKWAETVTWFYQLYTDTAIDIL